MLSRILLFLVVLSGAVAPSGSAGPGEPFKPFALKTVTGEEKSLPDVLGRKATLVVFFFPSCRYCSQALPGIQRLTDTYRDQGLAVVWINALPREQRQVADWQKKHGVTAPVLVGATTRAVEKDYDVGQTPTHYLLDSKGNVLSKHAGFRPEDEKALEEAIKRSLEQHN